MRSGMAPEMPERLELATRFMAIAGRPHTD